MEQTHTAKQAGAPPDWSGRSSLVEGGIDEFFDNSSSFDFIEVLENMTERSSFPSANFDSPIRGIYNYFLFWGFYFETV